MDKIFRLTKVTKFSDGDENFVQRKILSDIVLSDKVIQVPLKLVWVFIIIYDLYFHKPKFEKFQPNKLIYHNFKQYDSDQFKLHIFNSMSATRTHTAFKNDFTLILDKHAPKKTKILRRNRKPHFNKNVRKQIMIRSRLKN